MPPKFCISFPRHFALTAPRSPNLWKCRSTPVTPIVSQYLVRYGETFANGTDQSSLLAYARSHGLCTAYTTHDPLAPQNLLLPNVEPCGHDPDLAQLLNSKEIVPNEKLYLDKDCAVFLHKVFSPVELDNLETIDHSSSRPKSFKTDSPVLPTDPTLDSRMFTPSVHVQTLFDNLVWSDSDECNSSADFNWLEPDLATRLMSQTCSEKLQLTPKDLNFLQQSLKYGAGWEQHADVAHETGRLRRVSIYPEAQVSMTLNHPHRKVLLNTSLRHCSHGGSLSLRAYPTLLLATCR